MTTLSDGIEITLSIDCERLRVLISPLGEC